MNFRYQKNYVIIYLIIINEFILKMLINYNDLGEKKKSENGFYILEKM